MEVLFEKFETRSRLFVVANVVKCLIWKKVKQRKRTSCVDRINKIDRMGDDENPVEKDLHVSTRSTRLNHSVNSVSSVVENITQTAQTMTSCTATKS